MTALFSDLDEWVGNVDFVAADGVVVFGTAQNGVSRMLSEDGGVTWWGATEDEYQQEKLTAVAEVKKEARLRFHALCLLRWDCCSNVTGNNVQ